MGVLYCDISGRTFRRRVRRQQDCDWWLLRWELLWLPMYFFPVSVTLLSILICHGMSRLYRGSPWGILLTSGMSVIRSCRVFPIVGITLIRLSVSLEDGQPRLRRPT